MPALLLRVVSWLGLTAFGYWLAPNPVVQKPTITDYLIDLLRLIGYILIIMFIYKFLKKNRII